MSGRTVHQADLGRRLREAFKRIRILEARTATGGGGGYVFLDEQVAVADGDPIEFLAISQAYRHLAIEFIGMADAALPHTPNDVLIRWGNASLDDYYEQDYQYGSGSFWDATEPPPWVTTGQNCDTQWVPIAKILPAKEINCVGSGDDNPNRASGTIRFPYYCAAGLMRTVTWHAQGPVQSTGATTNPSAGRQALNIGGGSQNGDLEPIDRIVLFPSAAGWGEGSRASLYGIV